MKSAIVDRHAVLKRTVRTHDGRLVVKSYPIKVHTQSWAILTGRTLQVLPKDWAMLTGNAT